MYEELTSFGFGFIEIGTVTPKPQSGNPKKRLFRLLSDEGIINRMGFNNDGIELIASRLKKKGNIIVGGNIGKNKITSIKNAVSDYLISFDYLFDLVDYFAINVSSPNTENLRDLQNKDNLVYLLSSIQKNNQSRKTPKPILLKIAPDLTSEEISQIAQVARHTRIDAIIATNTTLDRTNLMSKHKSQTGGLSGKPLFEKSTRVLAKLAYELEGNIPIIGVGGIDSAEAAFEKIRAGASLVQLYTALVFHGLSLGRDIAKGLDSLLEKNGYDHISQAVGSGIQDYL